MRVDRDLCLEKYGVRATKKCFIFITKPSNTYLIMKESKSNELFLNKFLKESYKSVDEKVREIKKLLTQLLFIGLQK